MITKTDINFAKNYNYKLNEIHPQNKYKTRNSRKIIVYSTALTSMALGTVLFLSYKGKMGAKLQSSVKKIFKDAQSFFRGLTVKNQANAAEKTDNVITIKNQANAAEKTDNVITGKNPLNVSVELPKNKVALLNAKAKEMNHEMITAADGDQGLSELYANLFLASKMNVDVSNIIVKIMHKASRLEELLIEYSSIMQENNSIVQEFKCGSPIKDISNKELYINLIQKSYRLQEVIEYDSNGLIKLNDDLMALISSWM